MRRTIRVALVVAISGAVVLGLGQGVLWFAASEPAIRAGAWLAIGGSIALIVAAALLPVVFRGTDRRLAEASRAADGGQVVDPGRRSVIVSPILAVAILGSTALAFGISVGNAEPAICDVGPGWSCGIVRVPADRDAASSGLLEIAYTIHPATSVSPGAPRRVLVIAVGGPGVAGLPEADWMYDSLDPRVREQFDVVVYDPRSTGQSEFRDCPDAATAYYAEDRLPTAPSARTFAEAVHRGERRRRAQPRPVRHPCGRRGHRRPARRPRRGADLAVRGQLRDGRRPGVRGGPSRPRRRARP